MECTKEELEKDRRRCARVGAAQSEAGPAGAGNCFECGTCHRSFIRKQDMDRHKCQRSRDVHGHQTQPHPPTWLSSKVPRCVRVCTYVCMDGGTNGWMDGWMDVCVCVCVCLLEVA